MCVGERENEHGLAGRLSENVGERALLSELGSVELSKAKISYNLHSPAKLPRGGVRRGQSMQDEGSEREIW